MNAESKITAETLKLVTGVVVDSGDQILAAAQAQTMDTISSGSDPSICANGVCMVTWKPQRSVA